MKVIPIESNRQRLDGGAMFGNAPKEMWNKWTKVDEKNRIPLATRAMLVQTDDGRNVLFEAGIGAFFEPKFHTRYGVVEKEHVLQEKLVELGVDIDAVILSHLHFDHAGGVLSAYDAGELHLIFPKAKFYVGKKHWEYAQEPSARERASFIPKLHELLQNSGRLELVEGEKHPDLDFIRFSFSDGHTIGLMLSHLTYQDRPLVYASDVIPGMAWIHLPITMGYDRFPELKVKEKKQLLEEVITHQGRLFLTHDPDTACVEVKIDEKGKYYGVPVSL